AGDPRAAAPASRADAGTAGPRTQPRERRRPRRHRPPDAATASGTSWGGLYNEDPHHPGPLLPPPSQPPSPGEEGEQPECPHPPLSLSVRARPCPSLFFLPPRGLTPPRPCG